MSIPFRHIPYTDTLVFRVTDYKFLPWMEQDARHVVVMSSTRVNLPRLGFYRSNQQTWCTTKQIITKAFNREIKINSNLLKKKFELPFILQSLTWRSSAPWYYQWKSRMEGDPVDPAIVPLQHMLHDRICLTEQFRWPRTAKLFSETGRSRSYALFSQTYEMI